MRKRIDTIMNECVIWNNKTNNIDVDTTQDKTWQYVKKNPKIIYNERVDIMAWLENVYLNGTNITDEFLFVFRDRIEKLIVVVIVLEKAYNVVGGHSRIEKCDVPICLIGLVTLLKRKKKSFDCLHQEYIQQLDSHENIFKKFMD